MSVGIQEWINRVSQERSRLISLAERLRQENVTVELHQECGQLVDCVPFRASFKFCEGVITTIFFHCMDYQTKSDVVITAMTTLPIGECSKGHGSQAVQLLLNWAMQNRLQEIRATQVSNPQSAHFWEKNGFARCPDPNPCEDYLHTCPQDNI